MLTSFASVELQLSVDACPSVRAGGFADILTVGRLLTVTVALLLTDPKALVAVITYVVVAVGITDVDPLVPTDPIPGLIVNAVALVDVQERIDDEPSAIDAGLALSDTVGRLFTVTVTLLVTEPDTLLAVRVYCVVTLGVTSVVPLRPTKPIP